MFLLDPLPHSFTHSRTERRSVGQSVSCLCVLFRDVPLLRRLPCPVGLSLCPVCPRGGSDFPSFASLRRGLSNRIVNIFVGVVVSRVVFFSGVNVYSGLCGVIILRFHYPSQTALSGEPTFLLLFRCPSEVKLVDTTQWFVFHWTHSPVPSSTTRDSTPWESRALPCSL